MVINRPLLGVIQTGEKTHPLMVCEQSDELGADATHQGIAKKYPEPTCCNTVFRKMDSTKVTRSDKSRHRPCVSDLERRVENLSPHTRLRIQTARIG